jgi:glycerophosphoryl diester phosphodiesterase
LIQVLENNGMNHKHANVYIQSFEISNLIQLRQMTDLPIVQLIDDPDKQPFDLTLKNDSRMYPDLLVPSELAEIAKYADYVGVHKNYVIPRTTSNELGSPTNFINDANTAGLGVHIWTVGVSLIVDET